MDMAAAPVKLAHAASGSPTEDEEDIPTVAPARDATTPTTETIAAAAVVAAAGMPATLRSRPRSSAAPLPAAKWLEESRSCTSMPAAMPVSGRRIWSAPSPEKPVFEAVRSVQSRSGIVSRSSRSRRQSRLRSSRHFDGTTIKGRKVAVRAQAGDLRMGSLAARFISALKLCSPQRRRDRRGSQRAFTRTPASSLRQSSNGLFVFNSNNTKVLKVSLC